MQENFKGHISRRTMIAGAVLVPVTALTSAAQAPKPVLTASILTASQRRILEAFADRLVPHDEYGPSASECGVVDYIERSLGDYLAQEKPAVARGLAAVDVFARSTHGSPFAELPPATRDQVLEAMEDNMAAGFSPDSRTVFLR